MIRPRWQGLTRDRRARNWQVWDRAIAVLAVINLGWVIFDHEERRNAINAAMWGAIPQAMADMVAETDTHKVQ